MEAERKFNLYLSTANGLSSNNIIHVYWAYCLRKLFSLHPIPRSLWIHLLLQNWVCVLVCCVFGQAHRHSYVVLKQHMFEMHSHRHLSIFWRCLVFISSWWWFLFYVHDACIACHFLTHSAWMWNVLARFGLKCARCTHRLGGVCVCECTWCFCRLVVCLFCKLRLLSVETTSQRSDVWFEILMYTEIVMMICKYLNIWA